MNNLSIYCILALPANLFNQDWNLHCRLMRLASLKLVESADFYLADPYKASLKNFYAQLIFNYSFFNNSCDVNEEVKLYEVPDIDPGYFAESHSADILSHYNAETSFNEFTGQNETLLYEHWLALIFHFRSQCENEKYFRLSYVSKYALFATKASKHFAELNCWKSLNHMEKIIQA